MNHNERTKTEATSPCITGSADEPKKLGIGKSTLHYLRKNARNPYPFKVYRKAHERLLGGVENE